MFQLIEKLAEAHGEIMRHIAMHGDSAGLQATARKMEASLVAAIKSTPENTRGRLRSAAVRSLSCAALKLIPVDQAPRPSFQMSMSISMEMILTADARFLKALMAQGYEVTDHAHIKIIEDIARDPTHPQKAKLEMAISARKGGPLLVDGLLMSLMKMQPQHLDTIADLSDKALKTAWKANAEAANARFADMASLYDPGAAHPLYYRALVAYALLGAKLPAKDHFENAEIEAMIREITKPATKAAILKASGGITGFLKSPGPYLPQIVRDLESRRGRWSFPGQRSRRSLF